MRESIALPVSMLLPSSFVNSEFFAVLAAFVAVNTVIFASLSIVKIVPKFRFARRRRGRSRRSETRSIYPDGPL